MTVKYGNFILPPTITIDESSRRSDYCRFVAEPFERCFGHTVGNTIRRALLTAMEAPAIISVRIEGISHEFCAVEGIKEDVTNIVLNLKGALLRLLPTEEEQISREPRLISTVIEITDEMIADSNGQYEVTLKHLLGSSEFEVVNEDLVVFTATKPTKRQVFFRVAFGRGYVPSENHDIKDIFVDEIVIDSSFSPVRLVNYYVENTRVGQHTDLDRLILEITTDKRLTPEEALSFATQISVKHLQVFDQLKVHPITFDQGQTGSDDDKDAILSLLAKSVGDVELSVRAANCLGAANIKTIAELVVMGEAEMLKHRNFGKKSLTEIKKMLEDMNLSLGKDLSHLGITKDNVKEFIFEYQLKKAGEA